MKCNNCGIIRKEVEDVDGEFIYAIYKGNNEIGRFKYDFISEDSELSWDEYFEAWKDEHGFYDYSDDDDYYPEY